LRTTVAVHLLAVWAVTILLAAATAAAMIVSGAGPGGALLYAAGLAGVGWFFAAVGACCGQLLGERSQATGAAGGVVLVALLVRMVGDGVTALGGISWLTPFGLLSLSEPYAADRWLPMILLALASVGLGVVALWWSSSRDVGAGLIALRAARRPRLALLTSPVGFAVRRALPSLLGWGAALVAYFLLIGLLAVSLTDFLAGNPRFAELAAAAGFADLVRVEGYAASLLRLLPIPLGLFAALRIARLATDEAAGRWTTLFCTPVRRRDWPLTEALVVTVACVTLAMATAVATWVGTAVVDAGLSVGDALAGALAVVPVALLSLGAAVLAWGWVPRAVLLIGALPSVGGFVWWVLGESLNWPDWARSVSPYEHLAAVPAESPDLAAISMMLVLAALLLLAGVAGFVRRDLRG
jgi:ABC-2 type transport system permease protein